MDPITRPVSINGLRIGGADFMVIAGPCSIESRETFAVTAQSVAAHGAGMLRGGIFKIRTNPSSFQGLGRAAFEIVRSVRAQTGLPVVSELTDPRQIPELFDIVDMFQIGTRNMHNTVLLREVGASRKPVLLKRGFSATVEEWLLAAEYVADSGNPNVVLCERGIRTFERITRNTLDLAAVAYIKQNSRFPVLVDPSHGTGVRNLIAPMCRASAAVGADGLLLEVHCAPHQALSDADQALSLRDFAQIMRELEPLLPLFGRRLARPLRPSALSHEPVPSSTI